MRVLCVGTDYPPGVCGGYELQCAGAVAHLRSYGHEVRVLTSRDTTRPSPPEEGVYRELVRFPTVPAEPPAWAALRDELANAAALARHLRAFRPDVIAWWRLGELSMSLPGRAARAGVPAVGMVCDAWMLDGPQRDPWARRNGTQVDRLAARWLFVSRALREQVGGIGDVVPAGIELDAFPLAPVQPWRGRLLYAGRVSPLKGVDVAVRALALLPAATLAIVGDGDPGYARELRALAAKLGVSRRVTFSPGRRPAAMAGVYAAADAVLFPVRWAEPWGLVPLEAMATGRPVVATGTGGSAEYLHDGGNALVTAPGDAVALAAAVARLADGPDLRERLRRGGRQTAEAHPAKRSHALVRLALEDTAASIPAWPSRSRS